MSLIAAFLWNKSPRCSISIMVLDEQTMRFLIPPRSHYLPKGYFRFRQAAKKIVTEFFSQIAHLQKAHKTTVLIEFKTVFETHEIAYMQPAKESLYVHRVLMRSYNKTANKIKKVHIQPQLRRRLSGKSLIQFKHGLRNLHLVSRKKDTHFEYHLWAVALHATPATYTAKLQRLRKKMLAALWDENL